jgi:tetratricopeptide (TPR) repeat protein
MDSPNANRGTFQWEATLWHELAHVMTLQMSNYRVPRWLTEGISVYEETLKRKEWGRGAEMEYASRLNAGETLKLKDLNSAFTDPRTISLAYYEASLLVEHIVATYGEAGLHRLITAYGQGQDTDAALKTALDTTLDGMQAGFDQALDKRFGALRKALTIDKNAELTKMPLDALKLYAADHLDSYPAQMVLGTQLRKAGEIDAAVQAFERAAAAAPMATGDDSAFEQLAEIAIERRDFSQAIKALRSAMDADFDNVDLARRLARLMKEQNVTDAAQLRPVYERIVAIDPFDAEAQAAIGRLAMTANQPARAVSAFKVVIALKPVDQAAAYTDLAESYLRSGQRADARKQTLAALEIAPSYERAQNLLLELAGSRP